MRGTAALRTSGEHVFLGHTSVPAVVEVEHGSGSDVDTGRFGPRLYARVEIVDATPRLIDLRLISAGLTGIEPSDLAAINVRELVEVVVEAVSARLRVDDHGVPLGIERVVTPQESLAAITAGLAAMQWGPRSRNITAEHLQRVADIYSANIDHAPTRAVQDAFGVGSRTAAGYVQRARAEGLLPATTQGRKQA